MPRNILNNRMLRNIRKDQTYQAVITDLTLAGVISKEKSKQLLGYDVPDYLTLDDVVVAKPEVKPAATTNKAAAKKEADADDEE